MPSNKTLIWSAAAPAGIVSSSSLRLLVNAKTARSCRAELLSQLCTQARDTRAAVAPLSQVTLKSACGQRLAAVSCRPRGAAAGKAAPSAAAHGPGRTSTRSPAAALTDSLAPDRSPSAGSTNGTLSSVRWEAAGFCSGKR